MSLGMLFAANDNGVKKFSEAVNVPCSDVLSNCVGTRKNSYDNREMLAWTSNGPAKKDAEKKAIALGERWPSPGNAWRLREQSPGFF